MALQQYGAYRKEMEKPNAERLAELKREIAQELSKCIEETPYIIKHWEDEGYWTVGKTIQMHVAEKEQIEQANIQELGSKAAYSRPHEGTDCRECEEGIQAEPLHPDR